MPNDIRDTTEMLLAQLLDRAEDSAGFCDEDLKLMLAHQLGAPLEFDMEQCAGDFAGVFAEYRGKGNVVPLRFSDLLFSEAPPLELLELTRQFAHACRDFPDLPMQKIAGVLYYASIVVALLKCGARISQSDDRTLAKGFRWVLDQPWVDSPLRRLFEAGLLIAIP